MISPTDTAYPVLSASPSARELMDSFTPNLFELSFAEERTRQAASRVDLLVLLNTVQRLGYFCETRRRSAIDPSEGGRNGRLWSGPRRAG